MAELPDEPAARLARFQGPESVRRVPTQRLTALAETIRSFLVDVVSETGGHLGPNLGVVELTLALHRVFRSPHDTLLFDTGHQTYVHKMLTGRAGRFTSLRKRHGLSGYPSRAESVHDLVENSHASTVLSYADGLAKARLLAGERDRAVVAVIGDGACTGGMAWEALNNLGRTTGFPVIVVLNDNGRSYAPTVGGWAAHLAALRTGVGRDRNLFTDMGFAYMGPVDGHDVTAVEQALRAARDLKCPALVHVVTVKGKGYPPAEKDEADRLHTVGAATPPGTLGADTVSWTSVFGEALAELAVARPEVVAISAAMVRPTGLDRMADLFPGRVFDVGMAEQHAVTSAAGLAMGGAHPVVAIYATFLNRAFDQVLMDVALHRLPVTFVLDRAGITGADGPTHHGLWDISLLGAVPGLRLAAPRDTEQLVEQLREAIDHGDGPTVVRMPKANSGPAIATRLRLDGVDVLRRSRSSDVLLAAVGPLAGAALEAARLLEGHGLGVTVVDPRWVLPVPQPLVELAGHHRLVVSVEDGILRGGFGWALADSCRRAGVTATVLPLGLPAAFLPHGSRGALLAEYGLDAPSIAAAVIDGHAGLRHRSDR
ncbi:1-deoxy-D-xylulose-5-phosphate synthase [Streptomyces griseoluteus]|uniref:1-deoxy-D-xylulose-5-phosphate synthase n=1 Tax=Streptomyces griseoluteus TaxID=29306 RepID=UPI0036E96EEE